MFTRFPTLYPGLQSGGWLAHGSISNPTPRNKSLTMFDDIFTGRLSWISQDDSLRLRLRGGKELWEGMRARERNGYPHYHSVKSCPPLPGVKRASLTGGPESLNGQKVTGLPFVAYWRLHQCSRSNSNPGRPPLVPPLAAGTHCSCSTTHGNTPELQSSCPQLKASFC